MTGVDGRTYTSDQATIWRWRTAFQHDFAARMDWTVKDAEARQPQSRGRRERQAGKAPVLVSALSARR